MKYDPDVFTGCVSGRFGNVDNLSTWSMMNTEAFALRA